MCVFRERLEEREWLLFNSQEKVVTLFGVFRAPARRESTELTEECAREINLYFVRRVASRELNTKQSSLVSGLPLSGFPPGISANTLRP